MEVLFQQFISLLIQHYKEEHGIEFYARHFHDLPVAHHTPGHPQNGRLLHYRPALCRSLPDADSFRPDHTEHCRQTALLRPIGIRQVFQGQCRCFTSEIQNRKCNCRATSMYFQSPHDIMRPSTNTTILHYQYPRLHKQSAISISGIMRNRYRLCIPHSKA